MHARKHAWNDSAIFKTWVSFIPSVRHARSVDLVRNFTTDFEEVCSIKNLSIATFDVDVKHKNDNYTYVLMPMAYESEYVPASLLLIWVLAVSAAFQTYRAKHMYYIYRMENPLIAEVILICVHVALHIVVISRISLLEIEGLNGGEKAGFLIALLFTCIGIIVFPHKYDNSAPDYGRWAEYMLTAPIQIALIAMSVWLRDRSTLMALGAAQACMLLCGVVIENNLRSIYETNEKGTVAAEGETLLAAETGEAGGEFVQKICVITNRRARHEAIATLVVAWVTFGFIWFVIVTQFMRQTDTAGQCDNCASYPLACPEYLPTSPTRTYEKNFPYLFTEDIITQSGNLTVVTPTTTMRDNYTTVTENVDVPTAPQCTSCPLTAPNDMCQVLDSKCAGRSVIPGAVFYIVYTQCLLFALFGVVLTLQLCIAPTVHGPEQAEEAWYFVSMVYAILSVTAKTALEIGFLVMLTQMPE